MEDNLDSAVKLANSLDCDIVEIRLDYLRDTPNLGKLGEIKKPLMVTCMPEWEGGLFKGLEEDRIGLLRRSLEYADYVSIELKTEPRFRDSFVVEAGRKGVKVIIAYHDFKGTPPRHEIVDILRKEEAACADIAKVAFKPRDYSDVLNVMKAQVTAGLKIPVIALSMGELGRVSRIISPMLGGYLTFAAPSADRKAAEGQYTLDEMREIRGLIWR
jgi:3-dehydroquinate dehydratase type I